MKVYMYGSYVAGLEQSCVYAVSDKQYIEIFLTDSMNNIYSAYKKEGFEEYSYQSNAAKDFWYNYQVGLKWCSTKNSAPAPVKGLGTVKRYTINKGKNSWVLDKYDGIFSGGEFKSEKTDIKITGYMDRVEPFEVAKLNYVHLTSCTHVKEAVKGIINKDGTYDDLKITEGREENIPIRSLAEIGLMKDTTWLKNKNYYIVNDEEQAEKIFQYLDNYKGLIAYDTETTGLCINMFGEVGSPKKELIEKENKRIREEGGIEYKVDKLVGIIFCVEENVSYYFPCFNRKFKNLYADRESAVTKKVMNNILANYTVGELRNSTKYIANYIRTTPMTEWTHDVILMERVRNIVEKGNMGTQHGSFEYKVGLMYGIDTNIREDSMLLHQLLFKFENISSSNDRGESSTLKHLTKSNFGVDQLDLKDFFVEYNEDSTGFSRSSSKGKKKKSNIDFSYMDYEGAKAYAPADGDFTLALIKYFRKKMRDEDLMAQEYIYNVELLTSCAIGYMEFYGHRLDEREIEATKISTQTHMLLLEKKIRDTLPANTQEELLAFAELERLDEIKKEKDSIYRKDKLNTTSFEDYQTALHNLEAQNQAMLELLSISPNQLNLSSPGQVAELFYTRLGIPPIDEDGKLSVKETAIKPLSKMKDENQELKYPVVKMYMDWKNDSTLLTKFFGKLPEFAYPGGFIFSGYGQITTATGRMSCSRPNAQQYPHAVTKMVIPRENCIFVDADYSQIEYRTLTAMAKETSLTEKFYDPDMDYHTVMAALMYGVPYANVTGDMRSEAKTFNFGIPYGMGLKKLAFGLKGSESPEAVAYAKEKYDLYFSGQPNVRQFFDDVKEGARVYGYTKTKWERRRYYCFVDTEGKIDQRKMSASLRQAGNAVIQGCLGGDTLIQTKKHGIVKIENIVGQHLLVWNGTKWTFGDVVYSGKKQKCIVRFTNGQEFVCSTKHRFLVIDECDVSNPDLEEDGLFVKCKYLKKGNGIRINLDTSKLCIKDFDNRLNKVDCISKKVNDSAKLCSDTKEFECVVVESVTLTDDYIDMYDVCNTDDGYYVADGVITHNTAADIFKMGVARNFLFIRENNLFGKYFITNMVHDEQLTEISCELNVKKILAGLISAMELHLDGFPPLYVGAGVGASWDEAKGKMAEIHPLLGKLFVKETEENNDPLYADKPMATDEVYAYFSGRNYKFREQKVIDYVLDTTNHNQALHPVIGSLMNLQFDYGVDKELELKYPKNKIDIDFTKQEREEAVTAAPLEKLKRFMEAHSIDLDISLFKQSGVIIEDETEDVTYSEDNDESDIEDMIGDSSYLENIFKVLDESQEMYGCDIKEYIKSFGFIISHKEHILGIHWEHLNYGSQRELEKYLQSHSCSKGDSDAYRVVILTKSYQLMPEESAPDSQQLFVRGITLDSLNKHF